LISAANSVCYAGGTKKKESKKMKKTVAIVLAVVLIISAALFAFGCTKDEEKPAETTTQGTATISGKISISGSTSVKPVVAALAEAFEEINGDAEIDIQEGGSSVGIADATEKKGDMGMSSRELKDTETGLNETVIAYDGIAVIVHKDVSVDDLNKEQLQQVFAGTIRDWSELGGDPGAIVVIGRDPASGTRGAFEELVKLDGKDPNPSAAYAQEKDSTGAVKATVQTTKNAIGYISPLPAGQQRLRGVVPRKQSVRRVYPQRGRPRHRPG
jgi:phosphate transport system substrate-binding protein